MGENLHDALENGSSQTNVLFFCGPGARVGSPRARGLPCLWRNSGASGGSLATNICPVAEQTYID